MSMPQAPIMLSGRTWISLDISHPRLLREALATIAIADRTAHVTETVSEIDLRYVSPEQATGDKVGPR